MNKFFCTAGPIQEEINYFLPMRMDEDVLLNLIDAQKYFILHAPRQSGKTTAMRLLVNRLNVSGKYKAFYVNIETAQSARHNVALAMSMIVSGLRGAVEMTFGLQDPSLLSLAGKKTPTDMSGADLADFLAVFAQTSPVPTVVFIDEIDALIGDTLLSVLRQLRAGYTNRPKHFPQSVCLIGVRDVRDYRIWSEKDQSIILGGSAFNIKAESLTIENFSKQEVADLYAEHTAATGQQFTPEAILYAFKQTQGQPWLVNALAYQACFRDVKDRSQPITLEVMERSREALIIRQDTHIDALIDKLSENRVRKIMDEIIAGNVEMVPFPQDDVQYMRDLGFLKPAAKILAIANPIYQEVFPRALVSMTEDRVQNKTTWYQNPDQSLSLEKLMQGWVEFYREHSQIWQEKFAYKESGPHLLMLAFLQRIINGGGNIHREYALGRGRVDLLITFGKQKFVIELKVFRGAKTLPEGLAQTSEYMRTAGTQDGHLVIFDRSTTKTWDEKIYHRVEQVGELTVHVWGL